MALQVWPVIQEETEAVLRRRIELAFEEESDGHVINDCIFVHGMERLPCVLEILLIGDNAPSQHSAVSRSMLI